MSTRQLRRLEEQRKSKLGKAEIDDLEGEESDEPLTPPRTKGSIFAKLLALEESENEDKNNDSEEHEGEGESFSPKPYPASTPANPRKTKLKQNKNKHLRKPELKSIDRAGGDDIENALRQLEIKNIGDDSAKFSVARDTDDDYERICAIISVQGKYLKVANEMRKLFGKAAVENYDEMKGMTLADARPRQQDEMVDFESALRGNHLPGKGIPEIALRRNFFIQGKSEWPKGTLGGLTMEVVHYEKSDGTVEFRYMHNEAYQEIQKKFSKCVNLGDPQILINLLVENPDHISLLIQVSRTAKSLGKHALSSDLLERALFFMGKAATSHFTTKLSQGKARLDFSRPENRELWLAGYHYIKSLMMRGTYRTALEWAKLLLTLAPEADPYCMRLLIHTLSLRALEYKWLSDLYDTGFHEQWNMDTKSTKQIHYSHTSPSLVLAALNMQDRRKAQEILSQSMLKLPWLYSCLFSQLSLRIPLNLRDHAAKSKTDELFTEIYVTQTKDLWTNPEAILLLTEVGNSIPRIDDSLLDDDYSNLMTLDVVRFVYLDGTPDLLAMIPRELLNRNFSTDSDPIRPTANIYSYDAQRIVNNLPSHFGINYVAIARLSPSRNTNNEETDNEFTLYGISFADITEDGGQRLIPIETARRLFRHLRGSEGSDDENNSYIDRGPDLPENYSHNIEDVTGNDHSEYEENYHSGARGHVITEGYDNDDRANDNDEDENNDDDTSSTGEESSGEVLTYQTVQSSNSEGIDICSTNTRDDERHEDPSSSFSR